jgi:hypothetical protein
MWHTVPYFGHTKKSLHTYNMMDFLVILFLTKLFNNIICGIVESHICHRKTKVIVYHNHHQIHRLT